MIKKKHWIISLIAVFLIGWSLGYLSLPHLSQSHQFWLGAISAFFVCLLYLLLKEKANQHLQRTLVFLLLLLISISGGLFVFNKLVVEKQEANNKAEHLIQQSVRQEVKMIYAQEQIYQRRLVDKALSTIDDSSGTEHILKVIQLLNEKLRAIERVFKDSVIQLSPGKGHLLLSILDSKYSDSVQSRLFAQVNFSKADLEAADLQKQDLDHINLKSALLYKANLSGASLNRSSLQSSIMRECNLDSSILTYSNFDSADLSWSSINHTDLSSAEGIGSDLSNSSIKHSNLDSIRLRYAILDHTQFRNSSLYFGDFLGAKVLHTDYSFADLQNARFSKAEFDQTIFNNSILGNNAVNKEWFKQLDQAEAEGRSELLKEYEIIEGQSSYFPYQKYFLKAKRTN